MNDSSGGRGSAAMRSIEMSTPSGRASALSIEWLLTNGLGGYAMGTLAGVNARRYHGLLIASLSPPVRRIIPLHSVVAQIDVDGRLIELSTQQFGEAMELHPDGHARLTEAGRNGFDRMRWAWRFEGARVTAELHLPQGCNAADLTYWIEGLPSQGRATLRLRPLTPLRDFHALGREGDRTAAVTMRGGTGLLLRHDDVAMTLDAIASGARSAEWRIEPQWWRSFAYAMDRERGQEWREDAWSPGVYECELEAHPGEIEVSLRVNVAVESGAGRIWTGSPTLSEAFGQPLAAAESRGGVSRAEPASDAEASKVERLRQAAAQFVVVRRNAATGRHSASVIAGYPWFADWGRDTMISLPGLMLAAGRLEEARSTLLTFARAMRDGLVPNLFDDYGGAGEYNAVDASLWFVHAVHELWRAMQTGAAGGVRALDAELVAACSAIVRAYRDGAPFDIRMEPDGLIAAGDGSTQLTWMDAKRDGVAFTPRHGKPVEINALWHHALRCVAAMSDDELVRQEMTELADHVAEGFRAQFWWAERSCLHDVLSPGRDGAFRPDGCLRPNQIFAVSLPHSPLDAQQQRAVVRAVGERLLTPFGLRTLDPANEMYRGRYEGDLYRRDSSYHQGTVWPWLIGPYAEALLRVGEFSAASKAEAGNVLGPLLGELDAPGHGCVGQIAEVYDGDAPHRPSGCPAQAWSVAELLRVLTMIEPGQAGS